MTLIFETAKFIEQKYWADEFESIIVYGPLGYGKSSYAIKVMAEVHGDHNADPKDPAHWNYEAVKSRIVFHPSEFLKKLRELRETHTREKAIIWDDAGLWLNSMDATDPFVLAVVKYLNVARTRLGSIIFTTPLPSYVVKKVRDLPQARIAKVIKSESSSDWMKKPRKARIFQNWRSPDGKRYGVRELYRDRFDAILPDDFFKWYKPYRDTYAEQAEMMMEKATERLQKKEDRALAITQKK